MNHCLEIEKASGQFVYQKRIGLFTLNMKSSTMIYKEYWILSKSRRETNMNTKKKYGTKEFAKEFGSLTFGDALSGHRLSEEISQKEFAVFLGISPQSLCDIEKGRKIPSPSRSAKIARQLEQPESFWIRLALQDMLRKDKLDYTVSVA